MRQVVIIAAGLLHMAAIRLNRPDQDSPVLSVPGALSQNPRDDGIGG
jgi:hypothetical protein